MEDDRSSPAVSLRERIRAAVAETEGFDLVEIRDDDVETEVVVRTHVDAPGGADEGEYALYVVEYLPDDSKSVSIDGVGPGDLLHWRYVGAVDPPGDDGSPADARDDDGEGDTDG